LYINLNNAATVEGASKGTPSDAKCVTEILGENKQVMGEILFIFMSKML